MIYNLKATLLIMQKVARRAGQSILRDFSEVERLQVNKKGPADFVSYADKRSEDIIIEELQKARPDYKILAEESGIQGSLDSEHCFIIDPLDGTTNFLHGLPHWAIHIAYQYKGDVHVAVTYDPIKDEMFYAEKGNGAYLNQERIRVSGRRRMSEALFATGTPFLGVNEDKHDEYLGRLGRIMAKTSGVRRFGAATLDLAYVACGRYDGFFEYGLYPWDIAGGILLVREAGGFVVDDKNRTYVVDGTSQQKKWIIASNDGLSHDFLSTLNGK